VIRRDTRLDPVNGVTRRVVRLRYRKAESAQLRSLATDPDVIADRIDTRRRRIIRGMWFFLTLGLAFTTSGVQQFLAAKLRITDPMWWGAWLVEPMAAGILIMLLTFETEIIAHGIEHNSGAVARLKGTLLFATGFMNVWPSITAPGGWDTKTGTVLVHGLVPAVVFLLAEAMPVIQRRMTEATRHAYRAAVTTQATPAESEFSAVAGSAVSAGSADSATPRPQAPKPAPAEPETAPQPAPAPEPAPTSQPAAGSAGVVKRSRLRLPDSLLRALEATARQAAEQGRALTITDVQRTVKVPDDIAEQLITELVATNGKPLPVS
jgi:hypothetical protein